MSSLKVSPSRIARYFFQSCERSLRYSATPKSLRQAQHIPETPFHQSSVTAAHFAQGDQWEEEALRLLPLDRVSIAEVEKKTTMSERRFSVEQSLKLFKELRPTSGEPHYVYQATLSASPSFYRRYQIEAEIVRFSDCHPDLIEISQQDQGGRLFKVIDVKRSDRVKSTHRIQILLYALLLEDTLKERGVEGRVILDEGGVWLNEKKVPTWVSLEIVRAHLERFLREELTALCKAPADQARWHLTHRCEWCEHFEHCLTQAEREEDLSRLSGLSAQGKRFLNERGLNTIETFNFWLRDEAVEDELAESASLSGKRAHFLTLTNAFRDKKVLSYGTSTAIIPRTEDLKVFITAQSDALSRKCYLVGIMVQMTKKVKESVQGEFDEFEGRHIWVAPSLQQTEGEKAPIGAAIDFLIELFETVDAYQSGREWVNQLSVQCYCHSQLERQAFEGALLSLLEDPLYGIKAAKLLLYFTSPESVLSKEQTDEPLAFPLTPVLNAQVKLLATPISVSTTLPESLAVLGSTFKYERDPSILYPLGHGFKPDVINDIWRGEGNKTIAYLERAAQVQLLATAQLLRSIRERCIEGLTTFPPKFAMPMSNQINDPLLAKLAFFTRYEDLLSCLELRSIRDAEPEQAVRQGDCIALEVDSAAWFKVTNFPKKVEVGTFAAGLLGADTLQGRHALLSFNDVAYRRTLGAKMKSPYFYPTHLKELRSDSYGRVTHVKMGISGKQFALLNPGDRFFFYPRYVNYTSDQLVNGLHGFDTPRGHEIMTLYRKPSSERLDLPTRVNEVLKNRFDPNLFTTSQKRSFDALCSYNTVTLWGPPGTGKSYFISTALSLLFEAYAAAGLTFRVLITSFTHAAIENVMASTVKRLNERKIEGSVHLIKAGSWKTVDRPKGIIEHDQRSLDECFAYGNLLLMGSTVYGCLSSGLEDSFDLVVIDEASQVKLNEATIAIYAQVHKGGRLLLAGDHEQLPPITKNVWPELEESPQLNRSVLEALFVKDHPSLGCMLTECFRMNETLTELVASKIYGESYRPGSPEVSAQRLPWTAGGSEEESELVKACLDPEAPFVIVCMGEARAGQVSQEEALLTAELTLSLKRGLKDHEGRSYDDRALFYGDEQRSSGLFIVSPHHVQIDAIKRALSALNFNDPFVDTVDKMQGQEAECVIVSYGVTDAEFALREADFIYMRNRLNVSVTRARSKAILLISKALLDAPPDVLDNEIALVGLDFLRHLYLRASLDDRTTYRYQGLTVELCRIKG